MQPTYTRNQRQRPLQKSMFLSTTEPYLNRNPSTEYQYQGLLDMKRSNITPLQANNKFNNNNYAINTNNINNQPYTPSQHNIVNNNSPLLNFTQTPRHKQTQLQQKIPPFSTFNQPNIPQDYNIKDLAEKLQRIGFLVDTHEEILKTSSSNNYINVNCNSNTSIKHSSQEINEEIQTRLKDLIVPNLINQATKDIYEHIFNFKMEIQTLKDGVEKVNENCKNQINNWLNKEGNVMGNKNASSSTLSNEKIEEPGQLSSNNIHSLQIKLIQMQKGMLQRQQNLKTFILTQLQKNNKFSPNSPSKLKSSTIQSILSPILIEYQQLFLIKTSPSSLQKISFINNKKDDPTTTEILINACTYHIDRQGFLLDSLNRYIIDGKGAQIKLDEKHLGLLRQYNILN